MLVQDFLRSHGTLADLAEKYAIKATRSAKHPSLVLLKYNQIDSPMGEPIVQECRGLILDEANNWAVISISFTKFFNHGEGHAALIDWGTARVQEKLDGSLCVIYHYNGAWQVQTSGQPDASGEVGDTTMTFAGLFWDTWKACGYRSPDLLPTDHCFSFELMTKHNRVVVIHDKPRLVLIGARNRETLQELPIANLSHCQDMNWAAVNEFPLQSFEQIAATFESIQPLQQEGYVVVDHIFRRVKVKHPGYVAIHHLKDGHSTRRLVEIVLAGEVGEFTTYFPEWADKFDEIVSGINGLVEELQAAYDSLASIEVQKDFAIQAVKTRCSAALFSVRAKKAVGIREFVKSMRPEQVIKILGLKELPDDSDPN